MNNELDQETLVYWLNQIDLKEFNEYLLHNHSIYSSDRHFMTEYFSDVETYDDGTVIMDNIEIDESDDFDDYKQHSIGCKVCYEDFNIEGEVKKIHKIKIRDHLLFEYLMNFHLDLIFGDLCFEREVRGTYFETIRVIGFETSLFSQEIEVEKVKFSDIMQNKIDAIKRLIVEEITT